MSEMWPGTRVRSLRNSEPWGARQTGFLGREGTIVWIGIKNALVSWEGDPDGPRWWTLRGLEVVKGEGDG